MPARIPSVVGIPSKAIGLPRIIFALVVSPAGHLGPKPYHPSPKATNISPDQISAPLLWNIWSVDSYQFVLSSVTHSHLILCDPMDCSTPGFPLHHQLPGITQMHVHRGGDAIQPSHPLSSPSPPAFTLSQHQSLFQRVSFSYQVAKVLKFQLQHQSFQ